MKHYLISNYVVERIEIKRIAIMMLDVVWIRAARGAHALNIK